MLKFVGFLSPYINRISEVIGKSVAWLTLAMVLVTFVVVILRKFFNVGWIWLQESVTWMHAAVFMLAAAYTLKEDEHVRVDIFHSRFSPRKKAWVELIGVMSSWQILEPSWQSGGMRGLFLLKTIIPITAILLATQGFVKALQKFIHLDNNEVEH